MTFIASVIAKKGVAIIADSLVTSEMPILHYQNFLDYINKQPKNEGGDTLLIPADIMQLFNQEPVFTKDYEEKLFKLNEFTAITTTGIAYLNDKSIADIIEEFKNTQPDINDLAIDFATKLEQLSIFLNATIRSHLEKYSIIGYCAFIISYYEKHTHKTHICKAIVNESNAEILISEQNHNFVYLEHKLEWEKVVCDGQNKISEKVLYGTGKALYSIFPTIVNDLIRRLNISKENVPENFINTLINDQFYKDIFFDDIEIFALSDLSLQQAVDLASLLMRLEVDFQKYTKNIPTVGGLIKLAVIDENGFEFISGDQIESPKHLHI